MGRGRSLQSLDKDGRERVLQLLMVSTWSDLPCVFALSAGARIRAPCVHCGQQSNRIEDTTTSCHLDCCEVVKQKINRTWNVPG